MPASAVKKDFPEYISREKKRENKRVALRKRQVQREPPACSDFGEKKYEKAPKGRRTPPQEVEGVTRDRLFLYSLAVFFLVAQFVGFRVFSGVGSRGEEDSRFSNVVAHCSSPVPLRILLLYEKRKMWSRCVRLSK